MIKQNHESTGTFEKREQPDKFVISFGFDFCGISELPFKVGLMGHANTSKNFQKGSEKCRKGD